MKAKSSYVIVGMFVLLLSAGLIAGILWLTTGGPPKNYDFYHVYMKESVTGLGVDAPVKYKGVNVGRVQEIVLNPDNPEEVRLLLVVLEGTPVSADTVATLDVQGMATGLAHINLSGGDGDSRPLQKQPGQEYAVIQSSPSVLGRLNASVFELLGNLIDTSERLNAVLNEPNRQSMSATLVNVEKLSGAVLGRVDEMAGVLQEARGTLANVRAASEQLPTLIAQFQNSAAALEDMANALASTAEILQATGQSLNVTVESSGEDLRRFTAEALPEAASLVAELRRAAGNLRSSSETLRADPSVLVFGPPTPLPGPGEAGE